MYASKNLIIHPEIDCVISELVGYKQECNVSSVLHQGSFILFRNILVCLST